MRTMFIALALIFGWTQAGQSQTSGDRTIEIQHPWARATVGKTGAAYLKIVSKGTTDDRLVAASSPLAEKVELHRTINDNGVIRMRPVDAVDVRAGEQAELKPGGIHLMLIGLKHPLNVGFGFPLTLTFERAGNIVTTIVVVSAAAMSNDMPEMHGNMPDEQ